MGSADLSRYAAVVCISALLVAACHSQQHTSRLDAETQVITTSEQQDDTAWGSAPFHDGRFENLNAFSMTSGSSMASTSWRYLTNDAQKKPDSPVPVNRLSREQLLRERDGTTAVYRLGHSSLLLDLGGAFWLVDPVFSDRASPVPWAGPVRYSPLPLEPEQLPPIQGVIISHDHYDHLDKQAVQLLQQQAEFFVVPLKVGDHLRRWGVADSKIHELDWWQSLTLDGLELTATPAQHFSGRGLLDGRQTLWASWVIDNGQHKLFYSGDSGYFPGFRAIGERLGPFDLTIMENGAYDEGWPGVHMRPEETLQAHLDLGGGAMMPVHNGTFDLALHAWYEPLEQLALLAAEQQVALVTTVPGQRYSLQQTRRSQAGYAWWRSLMPQAELLADSSR